MIWGLGCIWCLRVEDWNAAFNYSSNLGFLQQCLIETRGKIRKSVNAPISLEVLVEFIDVFLNTTSQFLLCQNQSQYVGLPKLGHTKLLARNLGIQLV